jgi:hypothetical protein
MSKKNFKNRITQILSIWYRAVIGQRGIKGTLIALALFLVIAFIIVSLMPLVFKAFIFTFNVAVIIFVLGFILVAVIPYAARITAKHGFVQQHDGELLTADAMSKTLYKASSAVKHIDITVSYAHVNIFFTDETEINIDYQITEGHPEDFSYILNYDETGQKIGLHQGPNAGRRMLAYNLFINIPRTQSISFKGRLVEGALNFVGKGALDKFEIDAVNLPVNIKDVTIENLRISGLNLKVDASNILIKYANIKGTGSSFSFSFAKQTTGARLKTNSAVTSFSLNHKPIGKMFNRGSFLLWDAQDKEAPYALYEFNVITSHIDFYTDI